MKLLFHNCPSFPPILSSQSEEDGSTVKVSITYLPFHHHPNAYLLICLVLEKHITVQSPSLKGV